VVSAADAFGSVRRGVEHVFPHEERCDMGMKVREVTVVLERNGWVLVRQRGSHRHYRHPNVPSVVTVAGKPNTTVPPGTLGSIRRASGIKELR
jgi:predicted RNA binding protein YcfA (HicA-like mRNA interferase family)